MLTDKKCNLSCKVWIDSGGKPVLGKGGAQILEGINSEKSLTNGAKKIGVPYRYSGIMFKRLKKPLGNQSLRLIKVEERVAGEQNLQKQVKTYLRSTANLRLT
jgi:molybdenum-dependent DNA-binding transcriptional regulator ModE